MQLLKKKKKKKRNLKYIFDVNQNLTKKNTINGSIDSHKDERVSVTA